MGLLDELIGGALRGNSGGSATGGGGLGGALGDMLGGALGGNSRGDSPLSGGLSKPLLMALLGMLASGALNRGGGSAGSGAGSSGGGLLGGLGGLLEQFQRGGLGDVVGSWIGRGQNQSISPQQVGQALDPDTIRTLAQRSGLSEDDVLHQLSHGLPTVVDELTPEGRVPESEDEDPRLAELSRLSESLNGADNDR